MNADEQPRVDVVGDVAARLQVGAIARDWVCRRRSSPRGSPAIPDRCRYRASCARSSRAAISSARSRRAMSIVSVLLDQARCARCRSRRRRDPGSSTIDARARYRTSTAPRAMPSGVSDVDAATSPTPTAAEPTRPATGLHRGDRVDVGRGDREPVAGRLHVDRFLTAQRQRDAHGRLIGRADLANAHAVDGRDRRALVAAGIGQLRAVKVEIPALIGEPVPVVGGDPDERRRESSSPSPCGCSVTAVTTAGPVGSGTAASHRRRAGAEDRRRRRRVAAGALGTFGGGVGVGTAFGSTRRAD